MAASKLLLFILNQYYSSWVVLCRMDEKLGQCSEKRGSVSTSITLKEYLDITIKGVMAALYSLFSFKSFLNLDRLYGWVASKYMISCTRLSASYIVCHVSV